MYNIWLSRGLKSLICSICNFHSQHGWFHDTGAVNAELGDAHNGFPQEELVPACHTTRSPPRKVLGLTQWFNNVMKDPSLLSSSAILRILAVNLGLGSSWLQDGCLRPDSMSLRKCIQRHEGQVALPVSFYWGGNLSQKCLSLFIGQDWVRSQALTAKEAGKWGCFFFLAFSATTVGISPDHHRGNQVGEGKGGRAVSLRTNRSATVEKFATMHDTVLFENELSFRMQLKHKLHVVCVLDCIREGTQGLI